jgi:hypothetical protein
VRWSERQFVLPGHVANKIGIGATRNLVVRRCDPRHTAKSIQDDLEHIHNLVVIRVEFLNSSCYISTNSVHNAMFARTCMMSRAYVSPSTPASRPRGADGSVSANLGVGGRRARKYKGSKIDWDADECAQPLQKPSPSAAPRGRQQPRREASRPTAPQQRKSAGGGAAAGGVVNRFQLLNLEPEDAKDEDNDGTTEDGDNADHATSASLPRTTANEVGIAA